MLPVVFDLLRRHVVSNQLAHAFPTPALRKEREGRGTRCVGDASEIKSLPHSPLGSSGTLTKKLADTGWLFC